MNRESHLFNLVVRWEELRASGVAADPEELCRDCPELVDRLRQCLQALSGMDAILKVDAVPPETDSKRADARPICVPAVAPRESGGLSSSGPVVVPGYEILEELGRGGMGVVYKARQIALERIVAIKTLLPRRAVPEHDRRRFVREAKIMALLRHPNIVQIHEIVEEGENLALVMEYVPGENLSAKLGGKPLAPRTAAQLAAVLARTVQTAHDQGVVHRDLKPTNVLLTGNGVPKICDFGLAKRFDGSSDCTQTGHVLGTPSYMAPEQLSGSQTSVGAAADVYALGALLYELLTGRPPFLADNPLDTLHLVNSQEPVPPRRWQPKTPRDLETICLKCLRKEPLRRYASAQQLAEDLQRFLAGQPIVARPVGAVERGWRWGRTHPIAASLVAVSFLSLVLVLTLVIAFNRRLAQELERTDAEHRRVSAVQERLHDALAREVAERLDGDLRELAAVPLTLAALLENRRDWSEQALQDAMRAALGTTPLIFGLCVAFEPHAWRSDQENFALYLFRRSDGVAVKQLLPPSYQPIYRQWNWYRVGKASKQGRWSEPYLGEGADRTPMTTFSAPIRRDGRFVGVVTADLAMDYFRDLRRNLDRLDLGPTTCCFVVTSGNRVLAHPLERFQFPNPHADLAHAPADPSFRDLADQWHRTSSGTGRAVDFATGKPARFVFFRVPSADWTVVLATF